MIEIKNVTKRYPGGIGRALDTIHVTLPRGEIVGLFGENGAGKTTLMKCILQLHRYDGSITLDGEPITRKNIAKLSFATSEHSFFPGLSAAGHRDFYREHFPQFSDKRFTALTDFFSLPLHRPLRAFSTGQKNQFEVILALSQGADYILMDEPFSGNDVFNREDFYKVLLGILEPHETVLLSTHLIEETADFIGRAILLHQGQIVSDVSVDTLAESGLTLMDHVKSTYHYRAERVSEAIRVLDEKEEK